MGRRVSLVMVAGTVWTVVSLVLWGCTAADVMSPGPGTADEAVLAVAAGTAAVIAAICWSNWSRKRADCQKNMPLIRTLIAVQRPAPGEEPGQGAGHPPALRVVRRR